MYLYDNELEASQTPIRRKRIGEAKGGGVRAFIAQEALPFCELNSNDLVDTSDLCRIFGTSRRTIYRWITKHSLMPLTKAGRELLFTKGEVLRWYKQNRPRPGRPIGAKGGRP